MSELHVFVKSDVWPAAKGYTWKVTVPELERTAEGEGATLTEVYERIDAVLRSWMGEPDRSVLVTRLVP